ncbi:MAG: DNA polymerase III subunit beta [Parcubacteria group bacterium Athens1014_26]|nr:MAG: DNA polymerase III subunit beta [Parcubacteria group bacterium Athens1014_26]
MKIIILRDNLKEGLNTIGRAITENANLPILKNILIKTHNNKIKLVATNLELAITHLISCKVIEDGGVTIPFSVLNNIVINSDSERINLESINNNLIYKTDNYEANIQGLSEDEYPIIPKIDNIETCIKIDATIFKNSLLKVINSAQVSEIHPEISGILFNFQTSNLKLVATDSFRLAEKSLFEKDYKSNLHKGFNVIIPLKIAQEVIRVVPDGELVICVDLNQVLFKTDGVELISRVIDGNYPNYEQIIPKEFETECLLSREQFLNAVKLVSNFTGKVNDIKIKTTEGGKSLEVFSNNSYLGENKYLIPAKIKGENFNISFNWRYLMDGLKNFDSEELIFAVNKERPAILKSGQDFSYFYILMPIKEG